MAEVGAGNTLQFCTAGPTEVRVLEVWEMTFQ